MRSLLKVRSPSGRRIFLSLFLFSVSLIVFFFSPVLAEEGDAGEMAIPYQALPGGHYGQVTFVLDTPEEITEPCIIKFTESESYQEYYAEALKSNNYTVTLKLPEGTYLITSAGPDDDYAEIYRPAEQNASFKVERGTKSRVDLTIRSQTEIYHSTVKDTKKAVENQETEVNKPDNPQHETGHGAVAAGLVLLCIGIIAAFIAWKMAIKHDDQL